jgi:release factor glutamine methyltransferase
MPKKKVAAKKAAKVIATDINPYALECANFNAKLNNVTDKFTTILSDLFKEISSKFDLIIFIVPSLGSHNDKCTEL